MTDKEEVLVPRRSGTAPLVKYTIISVEERDDLRAKVAETREDTARLDYMAGYCVGYGELAWYSSGTITVLANLAIGSTLREAIDRARGRRRGPRRTVWICRLKFNPTHTARGI